MSSELILPLAEASATLDIVGGKGASLARLKSAGLPVPDGFHITTTAYRRFILENGLQPGIQERLQDIDLTRPSTLETTSAAIGDLFLQASIPQDISDAIAAAYLAAGAAGLPGVDLPVAVRSSATAEDLPDLSFAGQQDTYLNIRGVQDLLAAVKNCWASLWTARAISYRLQRGINQETVALAVVVQILIPAESAGILFTANPLSGRRDEILINAAWGLGEAIVSGKVTPDTLLVDKTSGKIKQQEIAQKTQMTVRTDSGVAEQSVPVQQQNQPVLDDAGVSELTRLANQIEKLSGAPQDIEWCQAAGKIYIVQSRPITTLSETEMILPSIPPTQWKLPKGAYMAMRNNIVELMAEPLTPLFATLGLRAVNTSLNHLLSQFFGKSGVMPAEIIITVNGYAYYNGSLKVRNILQLVLSSGSIMKRMFRGAVERWTEEARPRYFSTIEAQKSLRWRDLPTQELISASRQICEAAIDAYGALLSGAIPAAWISEAVFSFVYNRFIKRRSDPPAAVFLLGYDSLPIQAEKSLFQISAWAGDHRELADYLLTHPTAQATNATFSEEAPAAIPQPV